MNNNWEIGLLNDHIDSCLGKMLDKNKNKGELHPYLGNKSVRWGRFDLDHLQEMRFENKEHDRYSLKYGDLVVCEGGEPGRCAIWKDQVPDMKIQKALHRIRTHKSLNNLYLYYWLSWSGRNGLLDAYFTGTTIKHLTGKALSSIELPIPPLVIQEKIAHFLGSLDDKIELNRQMNETLEAMAQALFKSWFVDFDPVIDNALAAGNAIPDVFAERAEQRKAVKKDEAINPLFPDAFEYTEEMGWIPEGWSIEPLDKVADYLNGLALQKFRPESEKDEYYPVLKIAQLKSGIATHEEKASINIKPAYVVKDGDVIFSWSGSLVVDIWTGGKAALNQHLFKVTSEVYPKWFYLHYTKHHLTEFQRIAKDKAVTMGHIKRSHLKEALCLTPDKDLLTEAKDTFENILEKQITVRVEIKTLSKLRDTLLPKLLSGELRIPDAEKLVEEATR